MIARRLRLAVLTSLCSLAGAIVFTGSPAQALVTHDYSPVVSASLNAGIPAEGPHGEKIARPGPLELEGMSMTVDSGHLWTVEGGRRIDEFDAATGAFLAQLATNPEGVFFTLGNGASTGIAVGHATGEAAIYVGEHASQGGAIGVYDQSGALQATWEGLGTPAGSFSSNGINVAVDNSTDPLDERKGDVYVATPEVVDVFAPEASGKEHYVGQITGPTPTEHFAQVRKVAVNALNGDVVVIDGHEVDIFEPAALGEYTLVHKLAGTPGGEFREPFNLAVDGASGEIYIDDLGFEGFGVVVDQFSASGAYLGRITGGDTPRGGIGDAYAVAVDPATHDVYVGDSQFHEMDVFGPDIVFPDVSSGPATGVSAFGATLNGTVNPQNAGTVTCQFEWGTSEGFGKTAACEPSAVANGSGPVATHAVLSELQPDTTYFYRLQATNANGTNPGERSQDQTFTTPGPGVRDESVTDVSATAATFQASIDPHGVPASYYIQYGTTEAYGTDLPAPPGEAIGAGEGAVVVVPHHIQGLQPGTVYHYRVIVLSEAKPGEIVAFDGPDQVFATQTAAVSSLPDSRQWEMVSPPDKQGAKIYPINETGVEQAANSGGAISYLSDIPTELEPQGNVDIIQVLSTRGPEGWSTRDIALPHRGFASQSIGGGFEYRFFSEDLSQAVVQPPGEFDPNLSPEASEQTAMLHDLGSECGERCYRPLVTGKPGYANVLPGTVFGGGPEVDCTATEGLYCGPAFIGATPDLHHILLSVEGGLTEWTAGKLTPEVGLLPNGDQGEFSEGDNIRNAISRDGSRVILSYRGDVYMRDLKLGKTIQLDVPEAACVAENKCQPANERAGEARFALASADGSKVFFTSESANHKLVKGASDAGSDLYECEMVEMAGELHCDLSDVGNQVRGVVGASEDASYLYFVAEGVLAHGGVAGEDNLYVEHDGETKLVTILSAADRHDWSATLSELSARVSPDGQWVELMSQRSLTGYDNLDAVNGKPDAEVYLYDASSGRLVCASCDRTGARPTGVEYHFLEPGSGGLTGGPRGVWEANQWVAANVPGWEHYNLDSAATQPRYLSNSGRLFFNSGDALMPQDVNGTEDVYQYEPPGIGDCTSASATFDERSGGCVGLISSGTSAEESGFLDASENGGDVFFLTFSKLQPQDYDNSLDVYDAHECTSAAPCYPAVVPQPPACTTADACRAAPTPQPAAFGAPSSSTFSGAGNVTPASGGSVTKKSLTRAQKLTRALTACQRTSKKKRSACQRRAKARYGTAQRKIKASKKGKR